MQLNYKRKLQVDHTVVVKTGRQKCQKWCLTRFAIKLFNNSNKSTSDQHNFFFFFFFLGGGGFKEKSFVNVIELTSVL